MKKKLLLSAIVAVMAFALCGCSSQSANDTSQNESSSTEEETTNQYTDEFIVVDCEVEELSQGFYDVIVTVENNTDETKSFYGVSITDLDKDGNIIDSYMSYNKNAIEEDLKPGQELSISLTYSEDDEVDSIKCDSYEYIDGDTLVQGVISEPFIGDASSPY